MNAQILNISKNPSQYGGSFYYIFFKAEDGESYKMCVAENCRNFRKWKDVVERKEEFKFAKCTGLKKSRRDKRLLDADFLGYVTKLQGETDE